MAEIKSESVADFIPESVADLLRNQQRGCHFENYRAQDLRIIGRAAPAPCGRRLVTSAKRSMSGHHPQYPGILG
jgi:hypothetical protein